MITTAQAAARLKVARITILKWIENGRLKATKLGRDWMIQETDLDNFSKPKMGRPIKDKAKK